jgi:hypothetical protein
MYFVLGSCRVWGLKYENYNQKTCSIQSHYLDETIQYINFMNGAAKIKGECFREGKIPDNWDKTCERWRSSTKVVVEISSIKYCEEDGYFYNLLLSRRSKLNQFSELKRKMKTLILLISNKQLIIVPHANLYIDKHMGYNSNRTILQQLSKYCRDVLHLKVLDPMSILSKYGSIKCMIDVNHYSQFMKDQMYQTISQF